MKHEKIFGYRIENNGTTTRFEIISHGEEARELFEYISKKLNQAMNDHKIKDYEVCMRTL